MLEHWCEDVKKLEGWKIKHQVIIPWCELKKESVGSHIK
jgi:hypothetical protein